MVFSCLGCQISYYMHSAYHQTKLAGSRQPIDKVLKSGKLNDEQRAKLELVNTIKKFSEERLGLKKSSNYTSFVQLGEPYVTYVVQAAYPYELKAYQWKFPFVGKVPYKGYFKRKLADEEAKLLKAESFDTFVRGVSAYSTLGWFQDSVLSSMLRYDDYELVELIIHETVHTTLFIKDAADFNERLATFLGRKGMLLYYREVGGDVAAKQLKMAEEETADQKLFSAFLTHEVEELKKWYVDHKDQVSAEAKSARLKEIQTRFTKELRPKLKTRMYEEFEKKELNNAIILAYRTYEYSLDDFEKVWKFCGEDFGKALEWLKGLEKEKNPEQKLKDFAKTH